MFTDAFSLYDTQSIFWFKINIPVNFFDFIIQIYILFALFGISIHTKSDTYKIGWNWSKSNNAIKVVCS